MADKKNQLPSFREVKQTILQILEKERQRPIPFIILLHKVEDVYHLNLKKRFKISLIELEKDGLIRKANNYYLLNVKKEVDTSETFIGKINLNSKGNGFITLLNETEARFFVEKEDTANALNNDIVSFYKIKNLDPKKELIPVVVKAIEEHSRNSFVGMIIKKEKEIKIIPDDEKVTLEPILNHHYELNDGDKVLFNILSYDGNKVRVEPKHIIGNKNDVGSDILSVVYDKNIDPNFSVEAINAAGKFSAKDISFENQSFRKDYTNDNFITIDPTTSKDFDDAFCLNKVGNNYLLKVAIADVSSYVQMDDVLDKTAFDRGCSIYLVDRVIPMLPHNLSDNVCSLVPNEPRYAIVVEMLIDKNAKLLDIKPYAGIITNKRRFTYDEVNTIFDESYHDDTSINKMLWEALELSQILSNKKKEDGYINFEIPEPKITVDENGKPIKIEIYPSGTAQKMIEDFMVICNEAVTKYAIKADWPFIYRVHDRPNEDRMNKFFIEAKKLRFKANKTENLTSKTISQWLDDNKDNANIAIINYLLLTSMSKAEYRIKNIGHFGLASPDYTHFTSPIRRYPDLIIGRIFHMYLFQRNKYSDQDRNKLIEKLKAICEQSSNREVLSISTERDVIAMKMAEYMEDHLEEEIEATVVSVMNFGCFVQTPNLVEGLIRTKNMNGDYVFDEEKYVLKNTKNNITITIGSKVLVKVISSSKQLHKIDFSLVKFISNPS